MASRRVTVYLKGNYSPRRQDFDQGLIDPLRPRTHSVVLSDNDYGLNQREYPVCNIERIEYRD